MELEGGERSAGGPWTRSYAPNCRRLRSRCDLRAHPGARGETRSACRRSAPRARGRSNGSAPSAIAPARSLRRVDARGIERLARTSSRSAAPARRRADAGAFEERSRRAPGTPASRSNAGPSSPVIAHARFPTNSCVSPPESWSRRALGKPASRASRAIVRGGGGRYAIDRGRYAYASRSERSPPMSGTTRPKYTRVPRAEEPVVRPARLQERDARRRAGPPGRAPRTASGERRDVAQREPARDAVGARVGDGEVQGVGLHQRCRRSGHARACRGRSRSRPAGGRRVRAPGRGRRCRTRGRAPSSPGGRWSSRTARRRQPTSIPNVMTRFTRS